MVSVCIQFLFFKRVLFVRQINYVVFPYEAVHKQTKQCIFFKACVSLIPNYQMYTIITGTLFTAGNNKKNLF